jgi:hypothetical protein
MSERQLVTRDTLRRQLFLNAARKPLALGVGGAVLLAAAVIGTVWLLPVALVVYLALAAATLFDPDEAEKVGRAVYAKARGGGGGDAQRSLPETLSPALAALVERARVEERRIVAAIDDADLPLEEVSVEVEGLATEMERIAVRAQAIDSYLAGHDASELRRRRDELSETDGGDAGVLQARERAVRAIDDQLALAATLRDELNRFHAEMEHQIASLAVLHGQVVRISVSEDPRLQQDVASGVRDLRGRVGDLADRLRRATADLGERKRRE